MKKKERGKKDENKMTNQRQKQYKKQEGWKNNENIRQKFVYVTYMHILGRYKIQVNALKD